MNLLIIDSNFLCYRAMLSLKGLSHEEHATGVIFGFLRQIQSLSEEFNSPRFAFAWDSRKSFRRDVYPEYKKRPKIEDPEMEDIFNVGRPQFNELRLKVLPHLGFKNNFIQTGLEADDIIAQISMDHSWEMEMTYIVSSDEDLYQLLNKKVCIYNPRKNNLYTEADFVKEKQIFPGEWAWVKAVAGCTSDNVKGIQGVGEKTAIKYLKQELKTGSKKWSDILNFDPTFNLSLVRLPHNRSYPVDLIPDELNFDVFEGLCLDYGFNSFLKKDYFNKWRQFLCR